MVCQLIGRGYSAALRLTSILNLDQPVTKKSWLNHMTTLWNVAEEVTEGSMKKGVTGAKEYIKNRASEVPPEVDLSKEEKNIGVSIDGSLGLRSWASKQGIVDVSFEDTGKILDILKTSYCKVCKNLKHKREIEKISLVEHIESCNEHEPDCLLIHKGSLSVSENLLYHCKKYFCPKYYTANTITSKIEIHLV